MILLQLLGNNTSREHSERRECSKQQRAKKQAKEEDECMYVYVYKSTARYGFVQSDR